MLSSVATSNTSPRLTRATGWWNWLWVYLRSPVGTCWVGCGCSDLSGWSIIAASFRLTRHSPPRHEETFDPPDHVNEGERDRDRGEQRREHFRDVVEVSGNEDCVAKSLARGDEFPDDCADQGEPDCKLQS